MRSRQLSLADGSRIGSTEDGDAAFVVLEDPGVVLRLVASERLGLAKQLVPTGWQVLPIVGVEPQVAPGSSPNIVTRGQW